MQGALVTVENRPFRLAGQVTAFFAVPLAGLLAVAFPRDVVRPTVRLPQMTGEIERRLLVNYRVDPAALSGLLPPHLRPQLVNGRAVAGILPHPPGQP